MHIEVVCKLEALRRVRSGRKIYDGIVSISNPPSSLREQAQRVRDVKQLQRATNQFLGLEFYDTEDRNRDGAPQQSHLEQVRAFFRGFDPSAPTTILVHCEAGVSRSPAMAAVGLTVSGYSHADAILFVKQICHQTIRPNRLICQLNLEAAEARENENENDNKS
ncbi:hypothetical protein EHM76_02275 [bacterium]|nr:MAG: hypothetical protein EHM76_02275 [bacterium]